MSLLPYAASAIAASVFLLAPSKQPPAESCVAVAGSCRQAPWTIAIVHAAGRVAQSTVDSVITTHLDEKGRTIVRFAFDNPCEYIVTAQTRQMNDTLDVSFKTKRGGQPENNDDSTPEIYGCSATISNSGYEVIVPLSTHTVHVIRGFTGAGSAPIIRMLETP